MEVQYQRFNSNQGDNCPVTPLPLPQSLYGRTDGRLDGRSYGHVITKFSWLDGLPKFLTHGAPLARFARWSSAMNHEVYTRNAHNPKRELSFLQKIISCVKISKQFNEIDFNLT